MHATSAKMPPSTSLHRPSHAVHYQPERTILLPAYDAAQHLPPPPPLPTATLSLDGRLYLGKALMLTLDLHDGDPIDLVPPTPGSPYWHLDVRLNATRRIDWKGAQAREAKRGQSARVHGLKLAASLISENLTLCLLPGKPHYESFYPLLPDAYFATK